MNWFGRNKKEIHLLRGWAEYKYGFLLQTKDNNAHIVSLQCFAVLQCIFKDVCEWGMRHILYLPRGQDSVANLRDLNLKIINHLSQMIYDYDWGIHLQFTERVCSLKSPLHLQIKFNLWNFRFDKRSPISIASWCIGWLYKTGMIWYRWLPNPTSYNVGPELLLCVCVAPRAGKPLRA